jgi:hypothetical protein
MWRVAHRSTAVSLPMVPARAEPKWLFRDEEVQRKLRSLGYVQ